MWDRPRRYKIYSPAGLAEEVVGFLHLWYHPPTSDPKKPEQCRLAFNPVGGPSVILNGRVVVVDMEDDAVVYNPRKPPQLPPWVKPGMTLLTDDEKKWMASHREWPGVLELDWNSAKEFPGTEDHD